jgi:hypothetical protein
MAVEPFASTSAVREWQARQTRHTDLAHYQTQEPIGDLPCKANAGDKIISFTILRLRGTVAGAVQHAQKGAPRTDGVAILAGHNAG